ncbi:MAG: formate dehydrogenase accessory sulfurtransferase FdhD [Candidatus Zixiibacteriota bacterium]
MVAADHLPEEALVELVLSTGLSTTLICTPHHLPELVTGWLFTQGLVKGSEDICSLQVCDMNRRVLVQIKQDGSGAAASSRMIVSSGCSGGRVLAESFRIGEYYCRSELTVSMAGLDEALANMYERLSTGQALSGLHCAALVPQGGAEEIVADVDVGRHNAVDKVIGAALTWEFPFGQSVLVTSGRVSSDMVLKAIRAGIPIIATRRSVTSLAAEFAEKTGITVVARLSRGEPLVAGNGNRISG